MPRSLRPVETRARDEDPTERRRPKAKSAGLPSDSDLSSEKMVGLFDRFSSENRLSSALMLSRRPRVSPSVCVGNLKLPGITTGREEDEPARAAESRDVEARGDDAVEEALELGSDDFAEAEGSEGASSSDAAKSVSFASQTER